MPNILDHWEESPLQDLRRTTPDSNKNVYIAASTICGFVLGAASVYTLTEVGGGTPHLAALSAGGLLIGSAALSFTAGIFRPNWVNRLLGEPTNGYERVAGGG
jgi:hypothetical protein